MIKMNMNGTEARNGHDSQYAGPFGYSFPDTPYEPAPASPLGPALLDDNESNMLDNFFSTMNTNPFNDFWLAGPQDGQHNKSLGPSAFDWSTELPPTFEGSTTSLSQPSLSHSAINKPVGIMPDHPGSTSDIVAAASMLYQNGVNGPEMTSTFENQPLSSFSDIDFARLNGATKDQINGHVLSKQPATSSRAHPPVVFHTSKMFFDVHEPISPEQQASAKVRPLHWGSDISFMDQGYVAPPEQPNEEQRTKELLENLECLERQNSAANTRAPSPERITHNHQIGPWAEPGMIDHLNGLRKDYNQNIDDMPHPRKKQRTLIKEEDDENSDGDSPRQRSRRAKGSARRMSNDAVRKSRLSQGAKPPRENLSEEQKRSNHILSEQKRRNLIRQGFEDLCILVPGLKGGGFSKSAMLTQAADWLEDILRGNEILKAQLAELKAMNGLVMPR